jgi:hypothetical protein
MDPGRIDAHGQGFGHGFVWSWRRLAVVEQPVDRLGALAQASVNLRLDPPPDGPVIDVGSHLNR